MVLFLGEIATPADKDKTVLAMFFDFTNVFNLFQDDNGVKKKTKGWGK